MFFYTLCTQTGPFSLVAIAILACSNSVLVLTASPTATARPPGNLPIIIWPNGNRSAHRCRCRDSVSSSCHQADRQHLTVTTASRQAWFCHRCQTGHNLRTYHPDTRMHGCTDAAEKWNGGDRPSDCRKIQR